MREKDALSTLLLVAIRSRDSFKFQFCKFIFLLFYELSIRNIIFAKSYICDKRFKNIIL